MLQIKNTLGGGKPEGLYVWTKNEIGSELKEINKSVSTLPYEFYQGCAVIYNGEIHILGGADSTTKHYKWNGSSWASVSTLPYNFVDGCAVVLNNEIHILGSSYSSSYYKYHYKWNGSSWTSVSTLPYNFRNGCAVVLDNEIHILGSNGSSTYKEHYKWNGSSWTSVSTLPYNFYNGSAVVLDGEIHIFSSTSSSSDFKSHYKWDGSSWTRVSTLPYSCYYGSAVVFEGKIHIMGGDGSYTGHYRFDGTSWVSVNILPYSLQLGSAVVCEDGIHILGTNISGDRRKHYLIIGRVPTYTFLNYIVSDKENAYPDGGEKDGYWYEKVNSIIGTDKIIFDAANQLIPDAVKALSLVHTEEITPASDSDAILHSYVGTPNYFILTTEDFDWSNGYVLAVTNITYLIIGGVAMRKYILSGNKAVEGSASSFIDITSTSIRNTQNGYKFIAGHTYKLYVFA